MIKTHKQYQSLRLVSLMLFTFLFLLLNVSAFVPENGIGGGMFEGKTVGESIDGNNNDADSLTGSISNGTERTANDAADGNGGVNRNNENPGYIEEDNAGGTHPGVVDNDNVVGQLGTVAGSMNDDAANATAWILLIVLLIAAAVVLAMIFLPKQSREY